MTFLNFDITLGGGDSVTGILLNFVRFIMITLGLKELSKESDFFTKTISFAKGIVIYSAILYALNLFGLSDNSCWIPAITGIIATIIGLSIYHSIILGIWSMERKYNTDLNSEKRLRIWKPLAILKVLSYMVLLLPILAIIFILAAFVLLSCLCFVFMLRKTSICKFKITGTGK